MKQFLFCLTISLYGSILAVGQTTGTLTSHKFQSGGIERSYKYYQPANLSSGAPLVFVLHGYGGTADPKRFGMNPIADKYGFAVCYPQGEQDKKGKNCWNVGYPFQADMTIDDINFLCDLEIGRAHV